MDPRYHGPGGTSDKDRMYILCYDHTDWHCGRFPPEYIYGRHFFRDHVLPLTKYPRLKFGNQFGGGYYDHLESIAGRHPSDEKNYKELREHIRDFDCDLVGGTYSQAISAFLPEESAVRQFTYGLGSIKKHTGVYIDHYAFSENTGWYYLPQILNDFGFKGALLRSHYQPMGYPPEYVASLIKWTGPDGSSIDAIPAYDDNIRVMQHGMSGSEAAFVDWHKYVAEIEYLPVILDALNRYYDEQKAKGIDYVVVAAVEDSLWHQTFDQLMPMIDEFDPGGEKYRFVTLKEAIGIIKSGGYEPTTVHPVPNKWSYMHNAGYAGGLLTQWNSEIASRIHATDTLRTFAFMSGAGATGAGAVEHAFKQHLCAEAHDGYEVPETTQTAVQQILDADRALRPVIRNATGVLCAGMSGGEDVAVFFNTLNFTRREPVMAEVPVIPGRRVSALVSPGGGETPFDTVAVGTDTVRLAFIIEIPSLGYAVYRIRREPGEDAVSFVSREPANGIHEGLNCGVIVENNRVVSLRLSDGQCLVERIDLSANMYDISDTELQNFYKEQGIVRSVINGNTQTVIIAAGRLGSERFGVKYTLYKDYPAIDLEVSFNCDKHIGIGSPFSTAGEAWGEANHNCRQKRMNLNLKPAFAPVGENDNRWSAEYRLRDADVYNENVNLTRYTPFYPEKFQRENDFNTFLSFPHIPDNHVYNVNSRYWADLSHNDRSAGLIVCGKGNLIMTYDGGEWSFVQLQSSPYMSSVSGFTNERREFIRDDIPDNEYRWSYRLIPHKEQVTTTDYRTGEKQTDAHREGVAFNHAIRRIYLAYAGGAAPLSGSFLEGFDIPGVMVSSVCEHDGEIYIRLYEYKGTEHEISSEGLTPVSMDMRQVRENIDPKKINAYQICTYQIEKR